MNHRPRARRVYLNEYNVLMGRTTYLPLVSGLLRASAERSAVVGEHFEFAPFLFHRNAWDVLVDAHESPSVAAFSVLMWNEQLSLRVAAEVKRRHPGCLIVFGGANVPHAPEAYLREHPCIDVAVRGEGELAFVDVLERWARTESIERVDFEGLAGVGWRTPKGEIRVSRAERPLVMDLDEYPSAYLSGTFDGVLAAHPDMEFQAIVETNRGCPFRCTFCYWGKGGLSRKYRFHSLERVRAEIDWISEHGIRYVFNADSNFGIHRRDREIAEYLVEKKSSTGYPEKFRTCYGKNTDDKIFGIGALLHEHRLEKGITISYQSTSPIVQKNIQRDNIRLSSASELQRRFNASGIPVYTELILGLPGETYESWVRGIDLVLGSGLANQLFLYLCQIYPNTDLADPEYRRRFGIETRRIELQEIHGSVRDVRQVAECEEIVVGTESMTTEAWSRALRLSWVTMLFHSLKLGYFVLGWLRERCKLSYVDFLEHCAGHEFAPEEYPIWARERRIFDARIRHLLAGGGRGSRLPGFGEIYWDEEEASFLRIAEDLDGFYDELLDVTERYLSMRAVKVDPAELHAVLQFQRLRIPRISGGAREMRFEEDWSAWFDGLFGQQSVQLVERPVLLRFAQRDFGGDLGEYAKETILWGRKSGTLLTCVSEIDLPPDPGTAQTVSIDRVKSGSER